MSRDRNWNFVLCSSICLQFFAHQSPDLSLYYILINLLNSAHFKHSPLRAYFNVQRYNEFFSMLVCYLGNSGNCQKSDKIYLLSYWQFMFLNTLVHNFVIFLYSVAIGVLLLQRLLCSAGWRHSEGVGKCFYFSLKQEKSAKYIHVCRTVPHCCKYQGVKLLYPHL